MNIDELQSVKSQERQSDTLQQLRASFYEEAGEFIQQLREQREQAADASDDPFSSPEVQRLTDEIETAERTVEDIYDRRVGKLVKMASFAAADMPVDDDGLTKREQALFERLVDAIEQNREHILAVLDGEDPDSTDPTGTAQETPPSAESDATADPGVGAADLMGDPADAAPDPTPPTPEESADAPTDQEASPTGSERTERPDHGAGPETEPSSDEQPVPPDMEADGGTAAEQGASRGGSEPRPGNDTPVDAPSTAAPVDPETTSPETDPETASPETGSGPEAATETSCERTTLRITRDVGEIMGVDERSYDLVSEDVVTLPVENAEPLLQKDAAERLD